MKMKMMVLTVILLYVSQHALGVEVFEGVESVLLPCQVTDSVSKDSAVLWSREDLRDPIVHLRLQSREDLRNQNQLYRNRTWMRTDSLQTGDLSLTLRKPTIRDSSTYTCSVRKFGLDQSRTEVQLTVREPPPVWPQVLAAVLVPLVLLVLSAGVFIVYKMWKDRQVQQVEVEDGVESVQLSCKIKDRSGVRTVRLSGDVRVEWMDSDNRKVHVYQNGSDRPEDQDQVYRDRTEMKEDLLRTGDLSLTLKHLTVRDRGRYTCKVYKDGNFLRGKTVILWVNVQKVEEGVESVQLPFKTTPHLSGDVRVEWTDSYDRKVHVYQNSSDRPEEQSYVYRDRTEMKEDLLRTGDLSLTLKHLTVRDTGYYTCRVYKDRNLLRGKTVTLKVKGKQVEVEEGAESVQLPFKTTADLSGDVRVEWMDRDRKVHVYQNGSDRPEDQDQVYRDRTEMKEDLLRTGDLSLTLKHLTVRDTGDYTCSVYKNRNFLRGKTVTLKVKGQQVEVEEEEESVQLPFKTTPHLSGDVRVEWTDRDNRKVHVYQNGSDRPEDQDQVYRDRTEMKEDLLRTGDLSLTLKHLRVTDTGDYTCSVYKDGNLLRGKTVTLWVKGQQVEVEEEEEESVQLPLKTTADLSGHVRVEWTDRDNRKVHVYQNGSDRPEDQDQVYRDRTEMKEDLLRTGDLSLTLKHLTVRDTGGYTCRVYKDGNFLRGKTVTLWVKERCQDTKNSSFSPESTPLTADQSV